MSCIRLERRPRRTRRTLTLLASYVLFEPGGFVRYQLETPPGAERKYRICEVIGESPFSGLFPPCVISSQPPPPPPALRSQLPGIEQYKPYQIDGPRGPVRDDRKLLLKYAKSERAFAMDQISNAPFTEVRRVFFSIWSRSHADFWAIRCSESLTVGRSRPRLPRCRYPRRGIWLRRRSSGPRSTRGS